MLSQLIRVGIWIRTYLVVTVLLIAFTFSLVEVYVFGVGPMPQQPPQGYTLQRNTAILQWSKGTTDDPMTLQVSIGDPSFKDPFLERQVGGQTHTMRNLEKGKTYYWRVFGERFSSPVASFKTSAYATNF